jgi:hypothetical protein
MPWTSTRTYIRWLRTVRRTKQISLVLVVGIAIGLIAGLLTGTGLGIFHTTLFDAYRPSTGDEKIYPSASANPEAAYWRTVEKMAAEKAAKAEKDTAESKAVKPAPKSEPKGSSR